MFVMKKAAIWVVAFILLALGNALGFVDDAAANTMFVILPVLAIITIGSGCRGGRAA